VLDDRDKATLDLEAQWFKFTGAKEAAIREKFDESATIFYQRLGALIDNPDALAYSPAVVNRLRRLRDARRAQRTAWRTFE
jgi:hypothetical protein